MKLLNGLALVLVLAVLLTGCSGQDEGVPFFVGYTWEQLVGMALALLFGLFPGVNLFQKLKDWLGVQDQAANYMVIGASILLTVAAMLVTGTLDFAGFEFTLENILAYGSYVYIGSQIAYQRLKAGRSNADPE